MDSKERDSVGNDNFLRAGGPPEEQDEENLHGGAAPERGGGLAAKGDIISAPR